MKTVIQNVRLVLPYKILEDAWLVMEEESIYDFGTGCPGGKFDRVIDGGGSYLSPGFIDMHVHGAVTYDFGDGIPEHVLPIMRKHLTGGTTTILPTVGAATHLRLLEALGALAQVSKTFPQQRDIPEFAGVHMEGPYVNGEVTGALKGSSCRDVDFDEVLAYLDILPIKRWTIGPERRGAMELGRMLERRGITAAIGHSDIPLQTVEQAIDNGFHSITHLYSSCSFYHRNGPHREGGIVEAAFLRPDLDVEIIADGKHLPKEFLQMIYQIKGPEHIALITDATRCGGMVVPDGTRTFMDMEQEQPAVIEGGVAITEDRRCFAGSIALSSQLVRTMTRLAGVDLVNAVKMATLTPARMLGIDSDVGSIARGKRANLVLFDENVRIQRVIVRGTDAYIA